MSSAGERVWHEVRAQAPRDVGPGRDRPARAARGLRRLHRQRQAVLHRARGRDLRAGADRLRGVARLAAVARGAREPATSRSSQAKPSACSGRRSRTSPTVPDISGDVFAPPSAQHWLGTDGLGRDVAAGLVHGIRVSLTIGLVVVAIQATIGILLGGLAGYYGGVVGPRALAPLRADARHPYLLPDHHRRRGLPAVDLPDHGDPRADGLGRDRAPDPRRVPAACARWTTWSRRRGSAPSDARDHAAPPPAQRDRAGAGLGVVRRRQRDPRRVRASPSSASACPRTCVTWGSILGGRAVRTPSRGGSRSFPGAAIFVTVTAYNLLGDGLRDALDPRQRGT